MRLTSPTEPTQTRRVTFESAPDASSSEAIVVNIEELLEILEINTTLLIEFAEFCSEIEKGRHLTSLWQRLLEIQLRLWSNENDPRYCQLFVANGL